MVLLGHLQRETEPRSGTRRISGSGVYSGKHLARGSIACFPYVSDNADDRVGHTRRALERPILIAASDLLRCAHLRTVQDLSGNGWSGGRQVYQEILRANW